MNGQRVTIALIGMLLSACAFKPHRTAIPTPTDGGVKCAVDSAALAAAPKRCDEAVFDAHAIQHRHYKTVIKIDIEKEVEGKKTKVPSSDEVDGEYYLSFVEFDDQGWFENRSQMDALFQLLDHLEEKNKSRNNHTLIYVYAHGWKHNARACDNNVVCFSRLVERHDVLERIYKQDNRRTVVGVYIGWRGLPFGSFLNNLSFWTRKEAAARVGRGGVFELLTRLNDYRDRRQNEGTDPRKEEQTDPFKTQLVITGHSFGGLVVYEALSHALMERATRRTGQVTDANGTTQYDVAKSFGDFVMLVNPAFEGSRYEPLFHITTNRCYGSEQRPATMIVTSQADSATRVAFPIGRALGTIFQRANARYPDQSRSIRDAVGHDPRYQTHSLVFKGAGVREPSIKDTSDCGCEYLTATSKFDFNELGVDFGKVLQSSLASLLAASGEAPPGGEPHYGTGIKLIPAGDSGQNNSADARQDPRPRYASNYPYLVVKTNADFIPDHNQIYTDRFINFAQLFALRHIIGYKLFPLVTSAKANADECRRNPQSIGGLPSEQSCWLNDAGKSCSLPAQYGE